MRRYVLLTAGLGSLTGGLVIAQALLLAAAVAPVAVAGASVSDVAPAIAALAAVLLARAAVVGVQERYAHRAARGAAEQLRHGVLAEVAARGPRERPEAAGTAELVTTGLDALDGYLARFLPQLVLVAVVTPGAVLVAFGLDPIAAVTIAVTLPLIPLFMALVGWTTQARADARLAGMQRLAARLLDLVAGLPTLRAFGRARAQAGLVRQLGDEHRSATMGTLRLAFLSAFVLELFTTLSVALVAVGVGFRLVHGELDLFSGLAVLVLAPEIYLPLRQVGAQYHASTDGLAALTRVVELLEDRDDSAAGAAGAATAAGTATGTAAGRTVAGVSVPVRPRLRLREVGVRGRVGWAPRPVSFEVGPGDVVALAGASGVGKTALTQVALGLLTPDAGTVELLDDDASHTPPAPLADVLGDGAGQWWPRVAWVPQRPTVQPGTLADNVRLLAPDATAADLDRAAFLTGLDDVVASCPQGWDTRVGEGGVGLSAGQRQRLALTRAVLRPARLLVLDEPSAHLDHDTERRVLDVVEVSRLGGTAVLLVAHRPALLAAADQVVTVQDDTAHHEPGEPGPDSGRAARRDGSGASSLDDGPEVVTGD